MVFRITLFDCEVALSAGINTERAASNDGKSRRSGREYLTLVTHRDLILLDVSEYNEGGIMFNPCCTDVNSLQIPVSQYFLIREELIQPEIPGK